MRTRGWSQIRGKLLNFVQSRRRWTGSEWRAGMQSWGGRHGEFGFRWHYKDKFSPGFHPTYNQLQEVLAKLKEYSKNRELHSVLRCWTCNFQWHSTIPWDFLTKTFKSSFLIFLIHVLLTWLEAMKSSHLPEDSPDVPELKINPGLIRCGLYSSNYQD